MSDPAIESLQETWAKGDAYDYYMGRWSRRVAAACCGRLPDIACWAA